jgi:DNA-directed RNA polymerase subunit RPC12/RpoP
MSTPSRDPSVFDEPQFQGGQHESDKSEDRARRVLQKSVESAESLNASGQGIYEEPDILPGREIETIQQDWSCSNCGYNLRGLQVGTACPECGQRELYRPAPDGTVSYRRWLESKLQNSSAAQGWYLALLLGILGGPLAVIGAFFQQSFRNIASLGLLMMVAIVAPAVEETMKIASTSYIVERWPYLFRRRHQIVLAAALSGFTFSVIENFIYLNVYISNPGPYLIAWRWTVCVVLHTGCSALASMGLVQVWQRTISELRPPKIQLAITALISAIIVHGLYNALVTAYEFLGIPLLKPNASF